MDIWTISLGLLKTDIMNILMPVLFDGFLGELVEQRSSILRVVVGTITRFSKCLYQCRLRTSIEQERSLYILALPSAVTLLSVISVVCSGDSNPWLSLISSW